MQQIGKVIILFLVAFLVKVQSQLKAKTQDCECEDIAPEGSLYDCETLEQLGTCEQEYMQGMCLCSCGTCGGQILGANKTGECFPPLRYITGRSNLQIFASLLAASNASKPLSNSKTAITVFAPTDSAFKEFFSVMQSSFLEMVKYIDVLEPLVTYHILNRPFYKAEFLRGAILDTMVQDQKSDKATIRVDEKDKSRLIALGGPSNIIEWDNEACSSVVHIVDQVLLPVDV